MFNVRKLPSNIKELAYRPTIEPQFSDDDDMVSEIAQFHVDSGYEFSPGNQQVVEAVLDELGSEINAILEIGVHRMPKESTQSSTYTFLTHKPDSCVYIGVDLDDRSFLDNPDKNVYTIKTSSSNTDDVVAFMKSVGVTYLDILMIDGWHSINQVIRDLSYAKYIRRGGYIIFHDTNFHPGPVTVFDALRSDLFEKAKYCDSANDWGIGVALKLT